MTDYQYDFPHSEASHHHAYILPALMRMLPAPGKEGRLLDVGCGNGSLTNELRKTGYTVTGVDDSESGIVNALAAYPECSFISSSLYDLQPETLPHKFDVIVAIEVIEHLYYPRDLLRKTAPLLNPGGCLILSTPYHGYVKNLVIAVMGGFDKHWSPLWDGGHVKFWSPNTLKLLFGEEGWGTPDFDYAGRLPLLWKSMLCKTSPGSAGSD